MIEQKIIKALKEHGTSEISKIVTRTNLGEDQVRRGVEWLRLKKIANVNTHTSIMLLLDRNGIEAAEHGLPERRLLKLLDSKDGLSISKASSELGGAFGPALKGVRSSGLVSIKDGTLKLEKSIPKILPGEKLLELFKVGEFADPGMEIAEKDAINADSDYEKILKRSDFFKTKKTNRQQISLTDEGLSLDFHTNGTHTGAIDVGADVPVIYPSRHHPLTETIREVREAFVALGFTEIDGNLAQPGFWNFDALFTPQDHSAREMQDTFYIEGANSTRFATKDQMTKVANTHEKNWRYNWNKAEATRTVLRTHTTCVTINHLARMRPKKARIFSLGRVFRNEKQSYKHLAEFNQVEGVLSGSDATLRDLMGIQREFYKRIGLGKVRFWPTFFPYTEPSLQTMVYNERLKKWVEMFGMGIFRPEVTQPLCIPGPVLAWGGGIERIAMLKYGISDVREFYANDMKWLREVSKCQ
ncbi:MAG: phenylalanyl-tRNA synthetase, alpha subunit [Cenarchaeum symbiont of Oopsacas minuta]|nr:phenylalanyl-tRNA synthetase, alpha subunit [Cenarchaeum symbiont of Oopsacas minuta]